MVRVDEENNSLLVVVPNDQLSLAIGRQGQNVRLASRLMGWDIDVKSEQRYKNLSDPGYQSLLKLTGVDEGLADQLFHKGIISTVVLAEKSVDELIVYRSIDENLAAQILTEAKSIPVEQIGDSSEETDEVEGDDDISSEQDNESSSSEKSES